MIPTRTSLSIFRRVQKLNYLKSYTNKCNKIKNLHNQFKIQRRKFCQQEKSNIKKAESSRGTGTIIFFNR